jgi:hypothetical protein
MLIWSDGVAPPRSDYGRNIIVCIYLEAAEVYTPQRYRQPGIINVKAHSP